MKQRTWQRISVVLFFGLVVCGCCSAEIVNCSYWYVSSAQYWTYQYTVANPQGSGSDIYLFKLTDLAQPAISASPDGWYPYATDGLAQWDADLGYEITPGNDQLFELTSGVGPGLVNYTAEATDNTTNQVITYQGLIEGPLETSEPTTAALFAFSLLGAWLWRRRQCLT